jgi:nitroreductase
LHVALYGRRSVREFTPQQVNRDSLQSLVDAAIQAPSAMNEQAWLFTIITNRPRLDGIARAAKAFMRVINAADPDSSQASSLLHNDDFNIFYNAPALIVISAPAQKRWTVENCTLAAQNLMLAAHAEGLGSCWIGFAQSWLGTPEGKRAIELPEDFTPVAPIIVGYPKSRAPALPRSAPAIHWFS